MSYQFADAAILSGYVKVSLLSMRSSFGIYQLQWFIVISPAGAVAKYCDERLSVCVTCLSVCLSVSKDISGTTRVIFTNVCACCIWPWLGSLPAELGNPKGKWQFCGFSSH